MKIFLILFLLSQPLYAFTQSKAIVNGSSGLIVLENITNAKLVIQNMNGTEFRTFNFQQSESKEYYQQLDSIINGFDLFTYQPDYNIVIFAANDCEEGYSLKYKQGFKLFSDQSISFKFYSWHSFLLSENFLSISDLDINSELLKYHESPADSSEYITFKSTNEIFLTNVEEIQGEWIKVKRYSLDDNNSTPLYAWIRWTIDGELLIRFDFLL